eukprot:415063_1
MDVFLILLITTIILSIYSLAFTSEISFDTSCHCCHTYHNITAIKGDWKVIISSVYQGSHFWNLTSCTEYSEHPHVEFNLSQTKKNFGFKSTINDTFDVIYSVTALLIEKQSKQIEAPKHPVSLQTSRKLLIASTGCIFIVSAAGAAEPDVRANVYNGALCRWEVKDGVGENYYVDFA